jgi:uncharacterized repeat protein (TIGR01451 family)
MKKIFSTLFIVSFAIHVFASGHVATATQNNPTCNGLCDGSAFAMASGGVGPYGFTWTGPSSYTATGPNISGLCAGVYIVTAIDSSDMSTAMYTINLIQPSPLTVDAGGPGTVCSGSCVGMIANVTGGAGGPFTYLWNSATGLNSTTIPNPTACLASSTNYTVTVTDNNGCTGTATHFIIVNPTPVVTVNSPTICAGQAAVLTASASPSGGTYSWAPSGNTTSVLTISPGTTTTYTVTYTFSGCTATATGTVTVMPVPVVTLSPNPTVCGVCNGSITTSGSGVTNYAWAGPNGYSSSLQNPTGLCAGTFTLYASNGAGCNSTLTTNVANSSQVVATIGGITPASCGACDGGATVYVTGGNAPYTYLWSPGGGTSATATSLCAGTYTATVTDQNGCSFATTVAISNSSTLVATLSSTPTACGACNGSANVTASGGTPPYTYDWYPGTPTGDGTVSVSGLCVGTYTLIVSDAVGCNYAGSVQITNTNPVYVTGNATPSTCGACNGTVTAIATGGVTPYLYSLNNGASQTNGTFSGVCPGTYIETVTDVNGCSGIYTIIVSTSNSSNIAVTDITQNESGYGIHDGFINLTVSGSAPPFTFLWNNGATTEDIYSLSGGNYSVTVTDNNGECATYTYTISTTPSYGYITGYVYNDNNTNCLYATGDTPLSGYYVSATNGSNTYWGYTNNGGYYTISVPAGNYIVTSYNVANQESSCTNSYSVSVTGGSVSTNNNFSYVIPPVYDVCVYTWCNGIVPGFNGYYNVYLYNNGNQSASGVVYLVLPGLVDYAASSPTASNISGDTIFWNYSNLPGYSSQFFAVVFNTPSTAILGTPTVAYVNATITNGTDINPACNSYTYTRIITGSFDPNEKTVSPSGANTSGDIPLTEDEFTYLIRFQNTGSGPAVNINVTDTLSSLLDPMSFKMLDASHNYVVEMLPGNVVKWHFDNIMLPDSSSDEAGSHGHVQFRINKLNSPVAGQTISNKADIYFDFNAPVITNTAINTYVLATNIEEQINENAMIKVYPNPFSESTTFVIQTDKLNETYSFELTDVLGKKVRSVNNISDKQFTVSRNGLQNGIYFYNITNSEGIVGIGKLIIK